MKNKAIGLKTQILFFSGCALFFTLALIGISRADFMDWRCTSKPTTHLLKEGYACTQNVEKCEHFHLECKRGGTAILTLKEYADFLYLSEDGKFLVGLSNKSKSKAFWLATTEGKIIKFLNHTPKLNYCTRSASNILYWFSQNKPNLEMKVEEGKVTSLVVSSCDGKRIDLIEFF